jgi:glycosyltransferase involved in cell wall biosynthesis
MRASVVHDWFQGYHGSERVADTIREVLRDLTGHPVDVHTFSAALGLLPSPLAQSIVRESRVARMPLVRQQGREPGRWRYLLPYMPYYFRSLKLDAYDIVVSSTHACAAGVQTRPDAAHVCYCHTPMRYLWLSDVDQDRLGRAGAATMRLMRRHLRRLDLEASRRPTSYIANSSAVQQRIRQIYGRDSVVIHPPVDVNRFSPSRPREPDHFLWVHRFVAYKQPLVVAEAFRGLPFRLTMVGVGPLQQRVREMKPDNVTVRAWQTDAELASLFERATGFIHVAEEDFGMSMVEALAAGAPVIALRRGGALDIVRDGVDGVLLDEPRVGELRAAVRTLASRAWEPDALAARAGTFSRQQFSTRFVSHVRSAVRAVRGDEIAADAAAPVH